MTAHLPVLSTSRWNLFIYWKKWMDLAWMITFCVRIFFAYVLLLGMKGLFSLSSWSSSWKANVCVRDTGPGNMQYPQVCLQQLAQQILQLPV